MARAALRLVHLHVPRARGRMGGLREVEGPAMQRQGRPLRGAPRVPDPRCLSSLAPGRALDCVRLVGQELKGRRARR
eukprot:4915920-Pyramimonas_sp.AAC.1